VVSCPEHARALADELGAVPITIEVAEPIQGVTAP
jgi:hypothetical protein